MSNVCLASFSRDEFNQAVTVNGYAQPSDSSIYTYLEEATRSYSREEIGMLYTINLFLTMILKVTKKFFFFKILILTAMLMAQLIHESGGFQFKEEITCKETKCPGSYVDNVGLPDRHYYGRGFIQLTWGANYRDASKALGLGDELLKNPDEVATNTKYSVDVSTWYWETRVRPVLGNSNQFGLTTKAINGGIECSGGPNERAQKRYAFYQKIADVMKIQNKAVENGCYN